MTIGKKGIAAISAMLATTISFTTLTGARAAFEPPTNYNYSPITTQELKTEALIQLNNARVTGRLTEADVKKFGKQLADANDLSAVEQAWTDLEATLQVDKDKHVSLDNLCSQFLSRLNELQAKLMVPTEGYTFYRDRIYGILRIKKELIAKENFWVFWNFVILAIDFSSVQDRLIRALSENHPEIETFNDLVLRTDNYILRNEVAARMLTTYKSFEVEPDALQSTENAFFNVLKDKTFSRLATPEVHEQLVKRLKDLHYEAAKTLPTEQDIDAAILEVKRLLDSGALNGHIHPFNEVRIQHELDLISKVKQAYPGPNPGIDPIKKELRMEEVRFMSLDLRFLQDWLGRALRHDGEVIEAREEVLRVVRRTDLAYFSHRITKDQAMELLADVEDAIRQAKNNKNLSGRCRGIEAKMDKLVSDFSMEPVRLSLRYRGVSEAVSSLKVDRDSAAADLNRIGDFATRVKNMPEGPQKFGASIVAAEELEILRKGIDPLLHVE